MFCSSRAVSFEETGRIASIGKDHKLRVDLLGSILEVGSTEALVSALRVSAIRHKEEAVTLVTIAVTCEEEHTKVVGASLLAHPLHSLKDVTTGGFLIQKQLDLDIRERMTLLGAQHIREVGSILDGHLQR